MRSLALILLITLSNFTQAAAPLIRPTRSIGPVGEIRLNWEHVPGALGYEVKDCAPDGTCSAISSDWAVSAEWACNIDADGEGLCSVQIGLGSAYLPMFQANRDYSRNQRWRVRPCHPLLRPPQNPWQSCGYMDPVFELRLVCAGNGQGCPAHLFPTVP
jgi:hypothetical protein